MWQTEDSTCLFFLCGTCILLILQLLKNLLLLQVVLLKVGHQLISLYSHDLGVHLLLLQTLSLTATDLMEALHTSVAEGHDGGLLRVSDAAVSSVVVTTTLQTKSLEM